MEIHIYDPLAHEHGRIARRLQELIGAHVGSANAAEILDGSARELYEHLAAEERVLYPRLVREPPPRDATIESVDEHRRVRQELDLLTRTSPDDPAWGARARPLRVLVERHVDAEENLRSHKMRNVVDDTEARDLAGAQPARSTSTAASRPPGPSRCGSGAALDFLTRKRHIVRLRNARASQRGRPHGRPGWHGACTHT